MNAKSLDLASITQGFVTEWHYLSEYLAQHFFLQILHRLFCFRCWRWAVLGWPEEKEFWLQGQKKAEGYDGQQRDLEAGKERYLKEHVEQEHANEKRVLSEVD